MQVGEAEPPTRTWESLEIASGAGEVREESLGTDVVQVGVGEGVVREQVPGRVVRGDPLAALGLLQAVGRAEEGRLHAGFLEAVDQPAGTLGACEMRGVAGRVVEGDRDPAVVRSDGAGRERENDDGEATGSHARQSSRHALPASA